MADSAKPLPAGWSEKKTAAGKVYYVHAATKKSKWTRPEADSAESEKKQTDSSNEDLPEGWSAKKDKNGRTYFVNSVTKKSQWTRPTAEKTAEKSPEKKESSPSAASSGLAPNWIEKKDAKGRTFFANTVTRKSQWTRPTADSECKPSGATPPKASANSKPASAPPPKASANSKPASAPPPKASANSKPASAPPPKASANSKPPSAPPPRSSGESKPASAGRPSGAPPSNAIQKVDPPAGPASLQPSSEAKSSPSSSQSPAEKAPPSRVTGPPPGKPPLKAGAPKGPPPKNVAPPASRPPPKAGPPAKGAPPAGPPPQKNVSSGPSSQKDMKDDPVKDANPAKDDSETETVQRKPLPQPGPRLPPGAVNIFMMTRGGLPGRPSQKSADEKSPEESENSSSPSKPQGTKLPPGAVNILSGKDMDRLHPSVTLPNKPEKPDASPKPPPKPAIATAPPPKAPPKPAVEAKQPQKPPASQPPHKKISTSQPTPSPQQKPPSSEPPKPTPQQKPPSSQPPRPTPQQKPPSSEPPKSTPQQKPPSSEPPKHTPQQKAQAFAQQRPLSDPPNPDSFQQQDIPSFERGREPFRVRSLPWASKRPVEGKRTTLQLGTHPTPEELPAAATPTESLPSQIVLEELSVGQVILWLDSIGLGQYEGFFREQEISGDVLLELDEETFKEDLGVKALGHRKRLLREIKRLRGAGTADEDEDDLARVKRTKSAHLPVYKPQEQEPLHYRSHSPPPRPRPSSDAFFDEAPRTMPPTDSADVRKSAFVIGRRPGAQDGNLVAAAPRSQPTPASEVTNAGADGQEQPKPGSLEVESATRPQPAPEVRKAGPASGPPPGHRRTKSGIEQSESSAFTSKAPTQKTNSVDDAVRTSEDQNVRNLPNARPRDPSEPEAGPRVQTKASGPPSGPKSGPSSGPRALPSDPSASRALPSGSSEAKTSGPPSGPPSQSKTLGPPSGPRPNAGRAGPPSGPRPLGRAGPPSGFRPPPGSRFGRPPTGPGAGPPTGTKVGPPSGPRAGPPTGTKVGPPSGIRPEGTRAGPPSGPIKTEPASKAGPPEQRKEEPASVGPSSGPRMTQPAGPPSRPVKTEPLSEANLPEQKEEEPASVGPPLGPKATQPTVRLGPPSEPSHATRTAKQTASAGVVKTESPRAKPPVVEEPASSIEEDDELPPPPIEDEEPPPPDDEESQLIPIAEEPPPPDDDELQQPNDDEPPQPDDDEPPQPDDDEPPPPIEDDDLDLPPAEDKEDISSVGDNPSVETLLKHFTVTGAKEISGPLLPQLPCLTFEIRNQLWETCWRQVICMSMRALNISPVDIEAIVNLTVDNYEPSNMRTDGSYSLISGICAEADSWSSRDQNELFELLRQILGSICYVTGIDLVDQIFEKVQEPLSEAVLAKAPTYVETLTSSCRDFLLFDWDFRSLVKAQACVRRHLAQNALLEHKWSCNKVQLGAFQEFNRYQREVTQRFEAGTINYNENVLLSMKVPSEHVESLIGHFEPMLEINKTTLATLEKALKDFPHVTGISELFIEIVRSMIPIGDYSKAYVNRRGILYRLETDRNFVEKSKQISSVSETNLSELLELPFDYVFGVAKCLRGIVSSMNAEEDGLSELTYAFGLLQHMSKVVESKQQAWKEERNTLEAVDNLGGYSKIFKQVEGRRLLVDGTLTMQVKKKTTNKHFFIFTDVLIFAVPKKKRKLVIEECLNRKDVVVRDMRGSDLELSAGKLCCTLGFHNPEDKKRLFSHFTDSCAKKVFGEALSKTGVPYWVSSAIKFVSEHAEKKGIGYCLSSITEAKKMEDYIKSYSSELQLISGLHDPVCIASILLQYCILLPEPVLTTRLFDKFGAMGSDLNYEAIATDLQGLPDNNILLLKLFLRLFALIVACDSESAARLANAWTPCLIWPEDVTFRNIIKTNLVVPAITFIVENSRDLSSRFDLLN